MSTDNVIYVKKMSQDWAVWEDSASNDYPKPPKTAKRFKKEANALKYAHDLSSEIGYVEYGICRL